MSVFIHEPPPWHREVCTVGVTGTNGKTTTTTWIAAALACLGGPVLCGTTLGYSLGGQTPRAGTLALPTPASVEDLVAMMRRCRWAALEYTSEALAAGFARAWPARVGVFTNLSHDHLDAHGSAEHYLASKAQLFATLLPGGVAVLNAGDPAFSLLREVVAPGARVLTYGASSAQSLEPRPALDLCITEVHVSRTGTTFQCEGRALAAARSFSTRGIGAIYAENAAAALLASMAAGVPFDAAAEAIAVAPCPAGRFELVGEASGRPTAPTVAIDYAHTPDALLRTCAAARALADEAGGRLVVVFGAGGERDASKRAPMGHAVMAADHVVLTSDNPRSEDPRAIAEDIGCGLRGHANVAIELDRRAAIERAIADAGEDDVVLVAGKGHETTQQIGGRAEPFSDREVAANALAVRRRLRGV